MEYVVSVDVGEDLGKVAGESIPAVMGRISDSVNRGARVRENLLHVAIYCTNNLLLVC